MQKSQAPGEVLTPGDAARILGVTTTTLATWAKSGRIAVIVLPSGHRRYPAADVHRLARERTPLAS